MRIDNSLLDELTAKAKTSPRLRMNYDLRSSETVESQRMLNALEPGTVLPIHRHRNSSEAIVVLRGHCIQYLYDDNGNVTDSVDMKAGSNCPGMVVEVGVWHRIESLESGTVILEAKEGRYFPTVPEDIFDNDKK